MKRYWIVPLKRHASSSAREIPPKRMKGIAATMKAVSILIRRCKQILYIIKIEKMSRIP
jgi:hypothetical protein